jgi:hypothetical protein
VTAGTRIPARYVATSATACLLVLAAVAGLVQLGRGDGYFHARDWQVAASTIVAFLCGLCVTLGGRLLGRWLREPVGWLAVVVGVAAAFPLLVGTWWIHGWYDHGETLGKAVATAIVALLAALILAGARLLQRRGSRGGLALFLVVALTTAFVVALALADVWSVNPTRGDTGTAAGDVGGRLIAGAAVIGVAAFLLISLVGDVPLPRFRRRLAEPKRER